MTPEELAAQRTEIVEFVRHLIRATQGTMIEWIGGDDVFRANILKNSSDASRTSGIEVIRDLGLDLEGCYRVQTFFRDIYGDEVILSSFDIPQSCEESHGEDLGARIWELMEMVQDNGAMQTLDAMADVIVNKLSATAEMTVMPEDWNPDLQRWLWPDEEMRSDEDQ